MIHGWGRLPLVEGIEQHENRAEGDDATENQLIFALFDVDALDERIYSRKSIREIVESILKPLECFALPFEGLLSLNRYTDLVVYQVVGAKNMQIELPLIIIE